MVADTTAAVLPTMTSHPAATVAAAAVASGTSTLVDTTSPPSPTNGAHRRRPPGRSVSSDVWRHFDRELDERGRFRAARCRRCQRRIRGATATLRGHLKSRQCLQADAPPSTLANREALPNAEPWADTLSVSMALAAMTPTTAEPSSATVHQSEDALNATTAAMAASSASLLQLAHGDQNSAGAADAHGYRQPMELDVSATATSAASPRARGAQRTLQREREQLHPVSARRSRPYSQANAVTRDSGNSARPTSRSSITADPTYANEGDSASILATIASGSVQRGLLSAASPTASAASTPTYDGTALQHDAERQLIRWILADQHSYSVVDNGEFRNFCRALNPGFILPTAQELREKILRMI
ncbi:hypothetical protein THASP1DRAFT_33143 [Thamnocephalis sphaerospora]|uniref:BED-type domain-containing protein n=1 Tax=Thamnocephalis sphaerospora TaxID=78915 RepID=A0A4P9XIL0_9FUNG|nr:hypothetical protein THASP1DRAFT_33143 [Thamnocephalis sphaerospora]|eukprot:RKP05030.1 hypothetical protein THASP1DRAFT_33143 [Thamnocephalis sphaerospora]